MMEKSCQSFGDRSFAAAAPATVECFTSCDTGNLDHCSILILTGNLSFEIAFVALYGMYSIINRPGRLFNFGTTRVGAYYFPYIFNKRGHF